MNPKVSVIIATHNHAHFLPRAISSVKEQTYQDYELIIVNNGSTDNTEQVIKELQWEKLRYVHQENTGSVAGPRNTGLKVANGDYAAFLDSDDVWYPDKLEKVMSILEKDSNIDILTHDLLKRTETKIINQIKVGPKKRGPILDRLFIDGNFLLGSATVLKKDLFINLGGFDGREDFVNVEDYEAWLRMAETGCKFYFLNDALGELYVHGSNLSNDVIRVITDFQNVIKHHFKIAYPYPNIRHLFMKRHAISQSMFIGARNFRSNGSYFRSIFYYLKAIIIWPFLWKAYIFLFINIFCLENIIEKLKIKTIIER